MTDSELLIAGGWNREQSYLSSAYVFDTEEEKIHQVIEETDFKFECLTPAYSTTSGIMGVVW